MASYNEYYEKLKGNADKQYNTQSAANQAATDQYIKDYDASYEPAINNAKAQATASKADVDKNWQDSINTNAIQQAVNEKLLKEKMSAAGMTDSGLNRTQMTAISLQKGNADSLAAKTKAESYLKIQQSLDDYLSGIETNKAQARATAYANLSEKNQAVYNSIYNALSNNATELANADTAAETARYKAEKEAATARYKAAVAAETARQKAAYNAQVAQAKAAADAYDSYYTKATKLKSDAGGDGTTAFNYLNYLANNGKITEDQFASLANELGLNLSDYADKDIGVDGYKNINAGVSRYSSRDDYDSSVRLRIRR